MAGIVASTLRRKAFHKKTQDTKYQAIDQGHANVSPTDSRSSSRSSSLSRLENRSAVVKTPKGAQLCHQDFWPKCTNYPHPIIGSTKNFSSATAATATALAAIPLVTGRGGMIANSSARQLSREDNITNAQFESFDTLVPRANAWLQSNANTRLVKCETIEKKVTSLNDVTADNVMFAPKTRYAIYLKGLRLWYINTQPPASATAQQQQPTVSNAPPTPCKKLSFGNRQSSQPQIQSHSVPQKPLTSALKSTQQQQQQQQSYNNSINANSANSNSTSHHHPSQSVSPPTEIGYMNVIPRCIDFSRKYPTYENLPETYAAINAYLSNNPLEGKIITIETVPLKLPKKQWSTQDIKPDQTSFPDDFLRHILYITRIYFCYGAPEVELIGAQDFLPDFEHTFHWKTVYKNRPKYSCIGSAMTKARDWIQSVRNIAVTNVQTLEAAYRHRPGYVHTGVNFIEKAESTAMVRFVRVTYVRPSDELAELLHSVYSPPSGLTYKTFIPSPIKVAMCSGSPEYEGFSSMWERSKVWLKSVDRRIVSVETFYHPLHKVWHSQDGAETSVVQGEWTSNKRNNKQRAERKHLVNVVRVYLDGDYQEPPAHLLPPLPMVEEINDCRCSLM